MTTYSAITDASLQAGQPITTTLMFQLRDNPLAIAEADASAPRVYGANLQLIDEFIVTTATSTVILAEMDDTYDCYIIEASGVSGSSSSAELRIRSSIDGGATLITSNVYYNAVNIGSGFQVGGTPHGTSVSTGINVSTTSTSRPQCQFSMQIQNPSENIRRGMFIKYVSGSTSTVGVGTGHKVFGFAGVFNGIGFFLTSGNFTSGEFRLYGLRKE